MSHRIVWAWLATFLAILTLGRWRTLVGVFRSRRTFGFLALSAFFVGINWFVFIWAISHQRVIEASLGYFITPIVSLLLGGVILREPTNWKHKLAGLIATGAVGFEVILLGSLPWVTLVLACSFGFYGLVRKIQPIDSLVGLNIECLIIGLPSLAYIAYISAVDSALFHHSASSAALLITSGIVTAIPLLLFAAATARLNLSVVGFIMYINPTMQFLTAVFILNEPYPPQRIITFVFIWLAMGVFMWGLKQKK